MFIHPKRDFSEIVAFNRSIRRGARGVTVVPDADGGRTAGQADLAAAAAGMTSGRRRHRRCFRACFDFLPPSSRRRQSGGQQSSAPGPVEGLREAEQGCCGDYALASNGNLFDSFAAGLNFLICGAKLLHENLFMCW